MKKHLRWIIAIIVLAVMGVAYYYYLANKPADKDQQSLLQIVIVSCHILYPEILKITIQSQ